MCFSLHCIANDVQVIVIAAGTAVAIIATTVVNVDDEPAGIAEDVKEYQSFESETEDSDTTGCGGQSFTASTEVELADGTSVPITQVRVGDYVMATNVKTGKQEPQEVSHRWVHQDADLMDVTVEGPVGPFTIKSTQHHLFWDASTSSWTEAENLKTGDSLETASGAVASVESTTVVAGSQLMWDLTVSNDHDFYVMPDVTGSVGVLVHNCPNSDNYEKMLNGDNAKPNAFVKSVVKQFGLSTDQAETLHDLITGEGYTKDEIREVAKLILKGRY
jgi:hypothetical protein